MFYLSLLPYVSLVRTMSSFSLSRTPQLPSTLVYCTSLIILRSHSRIPLWRIRLLVYIPPVLVATTSELILLASPSYLSEVLQNTRNLWLGSSRLCSSLFLTSFPPGRVLVWVVDSYLPDSSFRPPSVRPDPVGSERNSSAGPICSEPTIFHVRHPYKPSGDH